MPTLNRPTLDAVAWGFVGGLSFLVLLTGYELATDFRASLAVKFGVALVVTVLAAAASALIASRLRENERA
ncbi:MAG TPA: hypothetical protein VKA37_10145 [Halobacteriales archaeon]|nr:hypothetical protein [Halobacteriales archaeon]